MFIGGMILGAVLIMALAWFIFIFAGKQERQSVKVVGYIIVGLLVAVVMFGPMLGSHMSKGKMGGGGMSCPMMSGGGMGGMKMGGSGSGGMMSGGMSCPMMSGGGMGGMDMSKNMDKDMIPLQGMIMNGKHGAMLKVPMIDNMRDEMMKSDFFVEAFAKSAMEKPEFLAKLKAQIAKAEEEAKKMPK